ncbi:MAG: Type II secretion system protein F [Arcobacter lacus]|nr:MAG: Type II secretion system protein F [Arcobacter lacus]
MFIRNKNKIDKFLFKSLIFYRYYELYKIFLLIEVFLKGKYEFYIAFSNSSYLIKNKYLLDKISLCNSLLYKGKSIAFSFDKAEIFDDIVINLINIAQQTNSIETISSDIKMIYKQKFDRSFDVFIGIIQPVFLIFMTFLILWIVMGIFIPLWDVSNIISL